MRHLARLLIGLIAVAVAAGCGEPPSTDDELYARFFEVDNEATPGSLNGVYVVQSTTTDGELYVHSMEEQSRLRVAVDDSSFHMAARCLDGVIIGATVDAELESGSPDHLVFTGEDVTGRQEASGIRCRVALGRGMFGGRASVELDGVTLVVESGAGPPSSMTLRKIADWPEPT